jgi:hypothetical protein
MICITPDTSKSIPSLTGLNITVCPSIFSGGIGSLTVGGLYVITREDQTALGSSKTIISPSPECARSLPLRTSVAIGNLKSKSEILLGVLAQLVERLNGMMGR